ncbi:hypothetical protein Gpo141_00014333, partial [Globisporangium polare]
MAKGSPIKSPSGTPGGIAA